MDSTPLRRAARAGFAVAIGLTVSSALEVVPATASPGASVNAESPPARVLPVVERRGRGLLAGGRRVRVWGFNYGVGGRYPILAYFHRPTKRRLHRVVADMREARALGANTLRIYLELATFMNGPGAPDRHALDALADLLAHAERLGVYLDITGDLVWRAAPAWYDGLPEHARWAVQACFWRAVARVAAHSPAVLVYELTSEPVIEESDLWYGGEFGGYTFQQRIVRHIRGRSPSALARRWIRLLRHSIHAYDHRHLIGLGMLPEPAGPFGAANVADLLDVLLVHEYPEEGKANEAIALVRRFSAEGKPVIVGETAPLWATPDTWRVFLCGSRRSVDGYLAFYDGRTPSQLAGDPGAALLADMLGQFLSLRSTLTS